MKLTGIVEDVFAGRTIFRGYATLRTLYELSKPGEYQRPECKERFNDLVEFFKNSSYTFFPELLFGWQIDDGEFLKKLKGEQLQGTIKLKNGVDIKKAKFSFQQNIGEEPTTKVISILIPEETKPLFTRIDGNHRLSALKDIYEQEKQSGIKDLMLNMYVPFSVLIQIKNNEAQKFENAFFYLINAKSVPLTTEENLKAISTENNFTDEEKKFLLKVKNINKLDNIINIVKKEDKLLTEVFRNQIYSFSLRILQMLESIDLEKIEQEITNISVFYNCGKLKGLTEDACLACIKFQHTQSESKFESFKKWLFNSKIFKIKNLSPDEIIDFYNNNFKKEYTVFVAMPYISDARVSDFNKLFKEVLEEISVNQNYELKLIPIMRFRGRTQRIDQRLVEKINECDIFVADLTTCNENVIFEVGLAEGANKPMILIKADLDSSRVPFEEAIIDITSKLPFDMDKLQWIPYSATGYYNKIKAIMRNNIPEILKELEKND